MPRWTFAALPLIALAAPLPAQAADMRGAVATLNDPVAQDRMADTIASVIDSLMMINIGPLAEAVARADPESDAAYIPYDATLGEVAGRDPDYGRRLGADVRAGTRMAGQVAGSLAVYAPVFKDMVRDLAVQWEQERDNARR